MKSIKVITALLASMCLLSSCDFFRKIVGKPTSEEIEKLKLEVAIRERAQRDSLAAARTLTADKAPMEAEFAAKDNLDKEYYVVLGSFKVPENAAKFKDYLEKKGYEIKEVRFTNGYNVIMTCGTNNYREAYGKMVEFMEFQFCPDDIWIYGKSQNLHE
ncbi:MAG: SPOR domain-containing protein [Bacteroidales bacterium]|nr:SPOR domain-containing protein [Bacteroidales bacterium]